MSRRHSLANTKNKSILVFALSLRLANAYTRLFVGKGCDLQAIAVATLLDLLYINKNVPIVGFYLFIKRLKPALPALLLYYDAVVLLRSAIVNWLLQVLTENSKMTKTNIELWWEANEKQVMKYFCMGKIGRSKVLQFFGCTDLFLIEKLLSICTSSSDTEIYTFLLSVKHNFYIKLHYSLENKNKGMSP